MGANNQFGFPLIGGVIASVFDRNLCDSYFDIDHANIGTVYSDKTASPARAGDADTRI
jgi:hypothetical protein